MHVGSSRVDDSSSTHPTAPLRGGRRRGREDDVGSRDGAGTRGGARDASDHPSPALVTAAGAGADELDLVDRAIQALPDRMREAILLHSAEGKDWREIAFIMRCSEDEVRLLYARSLNRLAELMEGLRRDQRER